MNNDKILKMMRIVIKAYGDENIGKLGHLKKASECTGVGVGSLGHAIKGRNCSVNVIYAFYDYLIKNNLFCKSHAHEIELVRLNKKPLPKKIKPGSKIEHNNKLYVVAELLNSYTENNSDECKPISAHRIYNGKVFVNTSIYIDGNYSLVA